jgi:hypothetical protein
MFIEETMADKTEYCVGAAKSFDGTVKRLASLIKALPEGERDPHWADVLWGFEDGDIASCFGSASCAATAQGENTNYTPGTILTIAHPYKKGRGAVDVSNKSRNYVTFKFGSAEAIVFNAGESFTIEGRIRANDVTPRTDVDGSNTYYNSIPVINPLTTNNPATDTFTGILTTPAKIALLTGTTGAYTVNPPTPGNIEAAPGCVPGFGLTQGAWVEFALEVDRAAGKVRWYKDGILFSETSKTFAGKMRLTSGYTASYPNFFGMYMGLSWHIGDDTLSALNGGLTPDGGGVSIQRLRVTKAARYQGANYAPPQRYSPFLRSYFDPDFDKTVFLFDPLLSPGEFRDLTGRHTCAFTGTGTGMAEDGEHCTVPLNTAGHFKVLGLTDDFVFAAGEDFRIDAAVLIRGTADGNPYATIVNNTMWDEQTIWLRFSIPTTTGVPNDWTGKDISLAIQRSSGTIALAATAPVARKWHDIYPSLNKWPVYVTVARVGGKFRTFINGLRAGYSDTDYSAPMRITGPDPDKGFLVGATEKATQNSPIEIYGLRITKGSTRGITLDTTCVPIEWGVARRV